jgi:hypothetical protein
MSCIIAPAVCGVLGIIIINSGLLFIRRAYNSSKSNPFPVPPAAELYTVSKIDKRLAVSGPFSRRLVLFCFVLFDVPRHDAVHMMLKFTKGVFYNNTHHDNNVCRC